MPVVKGPNNLASGLRALDDSLTGILSAEAVNRQRYVENRNYNLDVDKFEEHKQQFDETLAEQIRQFDENIMFNRTENELNRNLERELQDDQQSWMSDESQLERDLRVMLQDDQQDFLTVENKRDRAVEYHRIKKNTEMQNADRALQYEDVRIRNSRLYLGDSRSYSEMPDEWLVGNSGTNYDQRSINIATELANYKDGSGSDVIKPGTPVEVIENYIELINSDPANEGMVFQSMVSTGFLNRTPNDRKESGLQQLMLQRAGGNQADFDALSDQEKQQLRGAVVHDLNSLDRYEANTTRRRLEYETQLEAARNGSSAYASNGSPQSMYRDLAASNGLYFVMHPSGKFPVANSSNASATISQATVEMTNLGTDAIAAMSNMESEEEVEAYRNKVVNDMRIVRDRMAAGLEDVNAPTGQADGVFRWWETVMNGEQPSNEMFQISGMPSRGTAQGTAQGHGAVGGGAITVNGQVYAPGDVGYQNALKIKKSRERSRAASQELLEEKKQRAFSDTASMEAASAARRHLALVAYKENPNSDISEIENASTEELRAMLNAARRLPGGAQMSRELQDAFSEAIKAGGNVR